MLLRSEAQLGGGVPVAFSGVDIAGDSAGIFEDTPQLHVTCAVTFLCFAPDEGQLVKGVVNNTASDSVGLLVLDTFNASITAEGLKGYVHNAARGVWHKEGDEEDEITIGQEIEFVCVEMRTHDKSVYPPIIHTHSTPLHSRLSFPFRSVPQPGSIICRVEGCPIPNHFGLKVYVGEEGLSFAGTCDAIGCRCASRASHVCLPRERASSSRRCARRRGDAAVDEAGERVGGACNVAVIGALSRPVVALALALAAAAAAADRPWTLARISDLWGHVQARADIWALAWSWGCLWRG